MSMGTEDLKIWLLEILETFCAFCVTLEIFSSDLPILPWLLRAVAQT